MERLKLLFSLIDDELADSMKYGERAMHYKDTDPAMAELFYSLSLEEMKHKGMLHNQLVKEMNECIDNYPDKEESIKAVYDVLNEREVEWENSIKMYHSSYR
jgi:rubrerythrin